MYRHAVLDMVFIFNSVLSLKTIHNSFRKHLLCCALCTAVIATLTFLKTSFRWARCATQTLSFCDILCSNCSWQQLASPSMLRSLSRSVTRILNKMPFHFRRLLIGFVKQASNTKTKAWLQAGFPSAHATFSGSSLGLTSSLQVIGGDLHCLLQDWNTKVVLFC